MNALDNLKKRLILGVDTRLRGTHWQGSRTPTLIGICK